MKKILVVHGEGMDQRGKTQIDIFGPMTLADYNEQISRYAADLGVAVETFHSNVEADTIERIRSAKRDGFDGLLFNPSGYMMGHPALAAVLADMGLPAIEVHISNPARRGKVSEVVGVMRGSVTGFGIFGYYLALLGLRDAV